MGCIYSKSSRDREDVYKRTDVEDTDPADEQKHTVSEAVPLESVNGLEDDSVHDVDEESNISDEQAMLDVQVQPLSNCKYILSQS